MKKCSVCKRLKEDGEFNKYKKSSDGLCVYCRECGKEKSKSYYRNNKEKHIKECDKNRKRYYADVRSKINNLKDNVGCQIEGCNEHTPCCIDFHHLIKRDVLVSKLIGNGASLSRVLHELIKCSAVCSNCHRKIHSGIIESPQNTITKQVDEMFPGWRSNVRIRKPVETEHLCKKCGVEFEAVIGSKNKFCSDKCRRLASRKVERPSKEQLEEDIKNNSWRAIGRKYGVSDKCIVKWASGYDISRIKNDQ